MNGRSVAYFAVASLCSMVVGCSLWNFYCSFYAHGFEQFTSVLYLGCAVVFAVSACGFASCGLKAESKKVPVEEKHVSKPHGSSVSSVECLDGFSGASGVFVFEHGASALAQESNQEVTAKLDGELLVVWGRVVSFTPKASVASEKPKEEQITIQTGYKDLGEVFEPC